MEEQYLKLSQISNLIDVKRHTLNARLKNCGFSNDEIKRSQGNQIILNPAQVRSVIGANVINHDGRFLYIGNLKGGVGKTTLTYLLSSACSLLGIKTCVIDLDVQANLTNRYMEIKPAQAVFYDVIAGSCNIKDAIIELTPSLDIIPSSLKNSLIEKALTIQPPKHQLNWFNTLCMDFLRSKYELVIVDTPPHLTTLNSVFCLCLTENDHIVIPVCAEEFSLMGVQMFLDDLSEIRKSYEVAPDINISIVMNRFFQNQKNNLEMLLKMGTEYEGMLSEIIIRDSAKIRELMNKECNLNNMKQSKEICGVISSLLTEFNIIEKESN